MAADYVTWQGLTDRKYYGRHLPANREYNADLSKSTDLDAVKELFRSTEDARSPKSTLMLPIFAQWFTDSILRTKFKVDGPQDYKENESNHEIDLCQIYGIGEEQTRMLRALESGLLKSQTIDKEEFPVHLFEEVTCEEEIPILLFEEVACMNGIEISMTSQQVRMKPEFDGLYTDANLKIVFATASKEHKLNCFACGLEHGNSTMGNTLMNIIWFREHNRIARKIGKAHPSWDDERVFQTARNVNIVLLLKVIIEDYIVHISGFQFRADTRIAEKESWYRNNWMAGEFSLLYRWHDLIPDSVKFGGRKKHSSALRRNNRWLLETGIGRTLLDASRQASGKIMLGNTPEFLLEVRKMSLTRKWMSPYLPFAELMRISPFLNHRWKSFRFGALQRVPRTVRFEKEEEFYGSYWK